MNCAILGVGSGTKDTTLYTTFVTCLECSKMAITIGIRRIVCLGSYPETDFNLLRDAGIQVDVLDKKKIQYWINILLDDSTMNLIPTN